MVTVILLLFSIYSFVLFQVFGVVVVVVVVVLAVLGVTSRLAFAEMVMSVYSYKIPTHSPPLSVNKTAIVVTVHRSVLFAMS
jgi:hypothetical protein